MNFTISKLTLMAALTKAVPIASRRSTLPILSHLLFEATGGFEGVPSQLTITTTDLESGLRMSSECEVAAPGKVCIPGKPLYEAVRSMADGDITMELSPANMRMMISAGHTTVSLACMMADDFPAWIDEEKERDEGGEGEPNPSISIDPKILSHSLDSVLFAASSDGSRYNMNGVFFEHASVGSSESPEPTDILNLVTTDGRRLTRKTLFFSLPPNFKAIIPKDGAIDLKRLLDDCTESVTIRFTPKNVILSVSGGKLVATTRLVAGEYPNYRKVIPEENGIRLIVDREALVTTVKRVMFLVTERNKGINLDIKEGELTISATHPDLGTATDKIEGVDYDGEPIACIVNAGYLSEALGKLETKTIGIEWYGDGRPLLLRNEEKRESEGSGGSEQKGDNYLSLVMPMRR